MEKKTWIILGVIVLAFGALVGVSLLQANSNKTPGTNDTEYSVDDYNLAEIIEDTSHSGGYPEMIIGSPDAKVKIYEYGDYQCTACAPTNPLINDLLKEYSDGEVALVFRTMILSYHQNGQAAASAALAAYKQGYWKEYKDLLFANQNDWYDSSVSERQKQFEEYLMTVSDGKADLEQFRKDMASDETAAKIAFDDKLAEKADVQWTPYFIVGDTLVSQRDLKKGETLVGNLKKEIDKQLEAAKNKK